MCRTEGDGGWGGRELRSRPTCLRVDISLELMDVFGSFGVWTILGINNNTPVGPKKNYLGGEPFVGVLGYGRFGRMLLGL